MSAYCQLCGSQISGRGKQFHHPLWPAEITMRVCMDCAQNRPRCRECGLPGASAGLCATCSRAMHACLACGQPIEGKYYSFDGVGPYCRECTYTRPPCDACGAPLTQEYWRLSDGRVICASCHETAIYAPPAAAALFAELKERIAGLLGLKLNIPTGVALVDRNQLIEILQQQASGASPPGASLPGVSPASASALDDALTLGLYARRGMRRGIYIQTGLPRLLFLQIAGHEFAHAWQGENCPLLSDVILHEGFAEWVAYRTLGSYGYALGQERMLARKDLYGDGLRRMLHVEQRRGAAAVIGLCRSEQGGG